MIITLYFKKMMSSKSTVNNNAVTINQKNGNNDKLEYSTICPISNFESLSGNEDNEEYDAFKTITILIVALLMKSIGFNAIMQLVVQLWISFPVWS